MSKGMCIDNLGAHLPNAAIVRFDKDHVVLPRYRIRTLSIHHRHFIVVFLVMLNLTSALHPS
jgi:hypothetical protein